MAALGNNSHNEGFGKKDIISDEVLLLISVLLLAVLASVVSISGIVFNVFNILVFVKQGLNDTVNIGLMGLAVSDLCSLVPLQLISILRNPLYFAGVDIDIFQVQHLAAAWPHVTLAKISSWITAYIILERCLCVVVPLKIKTIITPRVTIAVIISIFAIMFLTLIPECATCYIAWRFDHGLNRSVLGLIFLEHREEMASISFNISAGTQFGSFGAVILLTVILVAKMKQKSKWRQSSSNFGQDSSKKETSNRDQKTIKMIILVAVIYCVCFLPMLCIFISTCLEPEFIIFGAYNNSFHASWCLGLLLDGVNSTVNIFVYYRMSTKFRTTFDLLIFKKK